MANKNEKTVFQLGTDAVSKMAHPRKHSQAVDEGISAGRSFLDEFKLTIERAEVFFSGESKKELSTLLEDIRFSDPVSVEEAAEDEQALTTIAKEILATAESGDDISSQSIDEARRLLAARNVKCKQGK